MEQTWYNVLLVAAGGALGAALRYVVSACLLTRYGTAYPWGTTTVNLLGALLFGLLWSSSVGNTWTPTFRLFVLTGILGGFTTFSTLAFEITDALLNDRFLVAVAHATVHLIIGLAAVWIGMGLGRLVLRIGA